MGLYSFKQLMQEDIKNVFLNIDEFSDIHKFVIDGEVLKIKAQVDANELIEREKGKYTDGIYKNKIIVYVSAEEFGCRPKQGTEITMDNKKYLVEEVADEMGVYSITLEAKRG